MEPVQITKSDIEYAYASTPWDLGNQVLYDLCRAHPKHKLEEEIIAKIWLIGRSYAAAIERRKDVDHTSDNFYETVVVDTIKKSSIDSWLNDLPSKIIDPWKDMGAIVSTHNRLLKLFSSITGLEKRSLASKYLHFHRPNLFYIYDSRAKQAIMKVTPRITSIREMSASEADPEYHAFCRRCQWLKDSIEKQFKESLTPRQIDKILLRITESTRQGK